MTGQLRFPDLPGTTRSAENARRAGKVVDMLKPIPLELIQRARDRLDRSVLRTPLLEFNGPAPGGCKIFLKLENLQPIGSFKIRGAGAALALADRGQLARGVYTASAGNMAQGLAFHARRLGIPCTSVVPDHAPKTKLDALRRLGAEVISVPFPRWWQTLEESRFPGLEGLFVHPVSDPLVMAGNATIGLEILEDLPDVDTILVPFGGGGLSCGIASAATALQPGVNVLACEVETAAPLAAAWEAGRPTAIDYRPSFVDGIGGRTVLPEMWPLARRLLRGSIVVSLEETRAALRLLLERNHVLSEGAGAVPLAAALSGRASGKRIVSVVSGGNIDFSALLPILVPEIGA